MIAKLVEVLVMSLGWCYYTSGRFFAWMITTAFGQKAILKALLSIADKPWVERAAIEAGNNIVMSLRLVRSLLDAQLNPQPPPMLYPEKSLGPVDLDAELQPEDEPAVKSSDPILK